MFWWVFLQIKSCLSLLPYMRPGNTLKIVSWGDNRAHWFPVSEGLGSSIAWFSLSSKHYFTYFCMILLFWGRRVNFILLFTSLWESESQILKYSYEKIYRVNIHIFQSIFWNTAYFTCDQCRKLHIFMFHFWNQDYINCH